MKQDGWGRRRHWLPRNFCRLLGLGCPKQAFAKIAALSASAKYGHGHPLIQAIAVGVISVLFYFVMMLGPFSQSNGVWDMLLSLGIPIVSSLFGGILYIKRG
jgi:hypothetical protein